MRALIALTLLLAGCGGTSSPSSPTPLPSPTPAPSQIIISATLTETLTGAAVGQFSQQVPSLPALLTIAQPGYLTRQVRVGSSSPTVDLIKDAAPFSLDFYRQLARNGFESPGALQPLALLTTSPSIYLQTTGLTASTVAAFEQAARSVVPAMTGGKLSVAAFQSGETLRPDAAGWITAEIINDDSKNCGLANVGLSAGHIWLNAAAKCGRRGSVVGTPSIFQHEIGHALGFYHVAATDGLMNATTGLDAVPSTAERYHASITYSRQPGNRDPDNDAVTSTPLSVRSVVVVVD